MALQSYRGDRSLKKIEIVLIDRPVCGRLSFVVMKSDLLDLFFRPLETEITSCYQRGLHSILSCSLSLHSSERLLSSLNPVTLKPLPFSRQPTRMKSRRMSLTRPTPRRRFQKIIQISPISSSHWPLPNRSTPVTSSSVFPI